MSVNLHMIVTGMGPQIVATIMLSVPVLVFLHVENRSLNFHTMDRQGVALPAQHTSLQGYSGQHYAPPPKGNPPGVAFKGSWVPLS